jgi:ABC-2 type transport system permease protein
VVRRLTWLKLRLLWNGLRADRQRRVGFPVTVAMLAVGGWYLATRYRAEMTALDGEAALQLSLWAALAFYAGWVTLPVVIFPLDENLDPAQFALAPFTAPQLVTGLGAAALVAPSVVLPVLLLGANLVVFARVLPAALLATALFVPLLVISSQLFTTAISALLRTRRGRDLTVLLVVAIGLGGFSSQQIVRATVSRVGLEQAVLSHPIDHLAGLLPPVAVQRVVTEAAEGRLLGALWFALVATGWVLGLGWVWQRLLGWMLTTPEDSPAPARTARSKGLAGRRGWGVRRVMARKELRFYLRDPRQRLVWTGAVIFVGLAAASILVGSRGIAAFRSREWLPLLAPGLVLFVGLPIALNLFGWERNAASFLFVLPARPRQVIAGKNMAAVLALVLETTALSLLLAFLSESWTVLRFIPALTVCAIGCQLAVGNVVSVLTPLRLPREGTDVFSQATEQGCLAIVAQLVSFGLIGTLLVLPSSVMVLTVGFSEAIPDWFAHLFALVWGSGFYGLSLGVSGWLLKRRIPEVVNWVQVV